MCVPANELEKEIYTGWQRYQQGDKTAIDDIYERVMPFCLKVAAKTCSKYIHEVDEEASIARLAIWEALDKYDEDKGNILYFLGTVIRNRIIDFKRSQKSKKFFFFSFFDKPETKEVLQDQDFFEEIVEDMARKQDIERYKQILSRFNIDFLELISCSPKHEKTRAESQKIAGLIVNNQELSTYLLQKKLLPIKELEKRYSINRKTVDRYRKYIIASVLIHVYNLSCLKEFVPLR